MTAPRAAGVTVAILLPALALSLWAFAEMIQAHREAARLTLRETARAYAASIDGAHHSAEVALRALAASPLLARGNMAGFRQLAASSLAGESATIILFDAHGQQLLNTLYPKDAPLPRDSSRFALEVVRSKATTVSDLEVAARPPQAATTTIGIPVPGDGAIRYVLAKTLSRDHLDAGLPVGAGMENVFAGVFDSRGLMVRGAGPTPEGVDTAKFWDLTESARNRKWGAFSFRSERGVKFHAAFARLRRSDWIVMAAIPVDTLDAPAKNALVLAGTGLVASLFLALLVVTISRRRAASRPGPLQCEVEASQARVARLNQGRDARGEVAEVEPIAGPMAKNTPPGPHEAPGERAGGK